ncbi:hypothetical protein ADU59_04700 [Pararhizobium polonicum]|uniref:Uncharacterized protein n=1 Tax=Pararhizobium polonicum TaxID=1612624 RepID=A0A1C7P6U1_9HYPH|nr:hypothetical protein [Pararhizobium polonicum]OBZ96998.1 hypothetical protein ADU59_04700 [Pararhizobium polonicum]
MLLPTQQAGFTAVTSLMQSVIDDAEKRRIEEEEKLKGKKEDKVLKAGQRTNEAQRAANEKINAHFFNTQGLDVNELKVNLILSLGKMLGIEKQEGQSSFGYGRQLENAIAQLDSKGLFALNEALGLVDLKISVGDLIKAIKNPYGEEDDKLEAALEERATGIAGTAQSRTKALQRLETVADPKTLEELKLERAGKTSDPTKIEDAETKAEREEEIGALEAKEKLEDVKDLHAIVKAQNEQALGSGAAETATAENPADMAIKTIQVLAAGAEAIDMAEAPDTAGTDEGLASAMADRGPAGANGKNDISLSEEEEVYLLSTNGPDMTDTTGTPILAIQVDENGIYALLAKKQAA